jgi:glutamate racemase
MIGVFDSGYGGLTVLREVLIQLPEYDFVYLGDNARAPYGARSYEVICQFTTEAVEYLFAQGCLLVVLACNTSSARALRTIQQKYLPFSHSDRRILGVIRPSAEALAQIPVGNVSNEPRPQIRGSVAVLGTRETIRSNSFGLELQKLAPNLALYQQECPIWAPLVEAGELSGIGPDWFVERDLQRILALSPRPQRILLACTHYPALLHLIKKHLPDDIETLTQAPIIAARLADWLDRHPEFDQRLSKRGRRRFLTTDDPVFFREVGERIMGYPITCESVRLGSTTLFQPLSGADTAPQPSLFPSQLPA